MIADFAERLYKDIPLQGNGKNLCFQDSKDHEYDTLKILYLHHTNFKCFRDT